MADVMTATNRMPLRSYLKGMQAPIDFIEVYKTDNEGKKVKQEHGAFSCGTEKGYVSAKVMNAVRTGQADVDDIEYAEVTKPGETNAVPCLMLKSKANILKTISLE